MCGSGLQAAFSSFTHKRLLQIGGVVTTESVHASTKAPIKIKLKIAGTDVATDGRTVMVVATHGTGPSDATAGVRVLHSSHGGPEVHPSPSPVAYKY